MGEVDLLTSVKRRCKKESASSLWVAGTRKLEQQESDADCTEETSHPQRYQLGKSSCDREMGGSFLT